MPTAYLVEVREANGCRLVFTIPTTEAPFESQAKEVARERAVARWRTHKVPIFGPYRTRILGWV